MKLCGFHLTLRLKYTVFLHLYLFLFVGINGLAQNRNEGWAQSQLKTENGEERPNQAPHPSLRHGKNTDDFSRFEAELRFTNAENFIQGDSLFVVFDATVIGAVVAFGEALHITPVYREGALELRFPTILINGPQKHRYYLREQTFITHEAYWERKPYALIIVNKRKPQTVSYRAALKLPAGIAKRGSLHIEQAIEACCRFYLAGAQPMQIAYKGTPGGNVSTSEVATASEKKLNMNRKLPASYTGNAAFLDGPSGGIKTNMLYWATTTPNVGIEFLLGRKTSLSLTAGYNPFNYPSKKVTEAGGELNPKIRHWLVVPEFKYWLCRVFERNFLSIHGIYGAYNVGGLSFIKSLKDFRYRGHVYGGGLSWGYQWAVGRNLGLEFSLGAGYVQFRHEKYACGACGESIGKFTRNYVGPTKLALSLIYFVK